MPALLKKIRISEVSLCDRGANPHAFVTLFKRDTPAEISDEEVATEAAKVAAAAAEADRQKEMNKMSDDEVMLKGAHAISAGTLENTLSRSTWRFMSVEPD